MVYADGQNKATRKKVRIPDLLATKGKRKLATITCYDAASARILERTEIDLVLVGDSLGHVIQGQHSTLGVTVDDVAYHTRCVAAALRSPVLIADMPFCGSGLNAHDTFKNTEHLMRAGAEGVKMEGATPELCEQISTLVRHGIPVLGHIGLTPQSVHAIGGYRIQGKESAQRERLLEEAKRLEEAGCFGIVLELVTPDTAAAVTKSVSIPTIGIGAGNGCDGQILVLHDMLGLNLDFQPKFLKHFARLEETVIAAMGTYVDEVQKGKYPE